MMQEQSLVWRNDLTRATAYLCRMVPRYDIYLTEWLRASKKKQADVVRDLEWNKAKVSLIASGKQQYMRDDVNELARYLNARVKASGGDRREIDRLLDFWAARCAMLAENPHTSAYFRPQ